MLRWTGALVAVTAFLAGCSESNGAPTGVVADCTIPVRFEGTVYLDAGFSTHPVEPLGEGDLADCDDIGPNARGAWFPESPTRVPVLQFPGLDPDHVIAVEFDTTTDVRVLVAEDAPDEARQALAGSGVLDVENLLVPAG